MAPDLAEHVRSFLNEKRQLLSETSDSIWEFAEPALQETCTADLLADILEEQGFVVERGVAGLPTAFVGSYTSGEGPVIGVAGEFDALPGLSQERVPTRQPKTPGAAGHGCGHNIIATATLGAALALKEALSQGNLSGTVKYYGCPAEESKVGKVTMVREGIFDDADAVLSYHPGDSTSAQPKDYSALNSVRFRFEGVGTHAAWSPHDGRSALDAVEIMNVGANYLREHIMPEARLHYVITHGGDDPNVVPPVAEVLYYIRAPKREDVERIHGRLREVARGAAIITGTEVEETFEMGCHNMIFNRTLGKRLHAHLVEVGTPEFNEEEREFARRLQQTFSEQRRTQVGDQHFNQEVEQPREEVAHGPGSADISEVSQVAPVAQFGTVAAPLGTPGHSWQTAAASGTSIGKKGMFYAAQVLALTMIDLFLQPELLEQAQEEFRQARAGEPYVSPLDAH